MSADSSIFSKQGFTLIEMLVVIVILAILLALVQPIGKALREQSEYVTCTSNIRSVATGIVLFESEHGGFPDPHRWISKSAGRFFNGVRAEWAFEENVTQGEVYPFIGSLKSYTCPTFRRVYQANRHFSPVTEVHVSYSMNQYFNTPILSYKDSSLPRIYPWHKDRNASPVGGSWQHRDLNLFQGMRSQVVFPSRLGLIGEENTLLTQWANYPLNDLALGVGPWNGRLIDSIASFHFPPGGDLTQGKSNVAFVDLHVERRDIADSKAIMTPEVIKRHFRTNAQ